MPRAGFTSRGWSVAAAAVAAILLFGGLLAGFVNRNVLDGDRFASHVDAVRRDPAVARQVGQAMTDQLLRAAPDLVAVRPLIEATSTSLAGSTVFSPIVRASAATLHRAFTGQDSGGVALRLVDVGSALAGLLPVIAPQAADRVPPNLSVTLEQAGRGSVAARTAHLAHLVGVLSWLLPVLALVFFAIGLWLAPDRNRAVVRTGWAVVWAGVAVGALAVAGAVTASVADEQTLNGALIRGTWHEFGGGLWWAAGLAVAAGLLIVAGATARIPDVDLAALGRRAWLLFSRRPERRAARIGRGLALAVVGLAAALRPGLTFSVLGVVVGLVLLVTGVGEIAAASGARREATSVRADRRWVPAVVLGVAVVVVATLVAVDASPADREVSAVAAGPDTCNGHVELCSRRYDDVAFPATHNAMSAADEPGWFVPEQPTGLIGQLDAGIRVLLIDTYYGQTTERSGLIATAPASYAQALADAKRDYGPDVVASALRLHSALLPAPTGPPTPYLCHGLCEVGATAWDPLMAQVRSWLQAHPREVVTFFIQDAVSPADTAAVFDRAGLLPYVHTQSPGQPWPTLGQMISSGRRVVVLMENHGGGATYPWLLQGFDWVQDTPYTNPTVADLSCTLNRGTATSPLFLVNYWLSNFVSLVSDARTVNAYDRLWPYVSTCREQRHHLPNYVAVNYYDQGDLFRVVDQLNGVH